MTTSQKLLLQAAHGPAQEARTAWAAWRKTVVWEEIDADSCYLLPALHRTLERLDFDDDWRPRLAGVYRKTWAANQLLRQTTAPAVRALAAGGVLLTLTAAPALVYTYQEDCGLRPLNGLHCLIRREQQETARHLLADAGWREQETRSTRLRRLLRGPAPASVYVAGNGMRLALWWRLNKLPVQCAFDFQARARATAWPDAALKAITPADALQQIARQADYGGALQRAGDTLAVRQNSDEKGNSKATDAG